MKFLRVAMVGGIVAAAPAWAVYAPIPAQETPNDLTLSARAGVSYDTNLFGAATNAIESMVLEFSPRISYNISPTERTFVAMSYGLTLNHFENRPGKKLLDSHDFMLRLAHQFTKATTLDVTETFMISRNPESLLAGVPLNTDQSFQRNQLDGRFNTALTGKLGMTLKARTVYFEYRNATLGRNLDRIENIFGASADYALVPELKLVGEYRHLDVFYSKLGETKNKRSDFLMAGVDYSVAKKISLSGRLGNEWRARAAERNAQSPYAELSLKYDYAEASYLAAGYGYALEETSDTARFTDSQVHRFFLNAQHRFTALITGSVSLGYEPSQLQGRRGVSNVAEDTTRAGAALSYAPTKNWMVSATYDHDRVESDEATRNLRRERVGLSVSYSR